jgi:hypothetical protein
MTIGHVRTPQSRAEQSRAYSKTVGALALSGPGDKMAKGDNNSRVKDSPSQKALDLQHSQKYLDWISDMFRIRSILFFILTS